MGVDNVDNYGGGEVKFKEKYQRQQTTKVKQELTVTQTKLNDTRSNITNDLHCKNSKNTTKKI